MKKYDMACSDIYLKNSEQQINGRTIDYSISMDMFKFTSIPRGSKIISPTSEPHYQTKYQFIGITKHTIDDLSFVDGMNEHGLSIASLWMDESKYASRDSTGNTIQVTYLLGFLLGNCKDIHEVRDELSKITVIAYPKNLSLLYQFAVHDSSGTSIVVEFLEGKTVIYDNDQYGVLTNEPAFLNQLRIYDSYFEVDCIGSRSQIARVPKTILSKDRFSLLANISEEVKRTNSVEEAVLTTFEILAEVTSYDLKDEPLNHWPTGLAIVKDMRNLDMYYRTKKNPNIRKISLTDFEFGTNIKHMELENIPWFTNTTELFK